MADLVTNDPQIAAIIENETRRQEATLNLIASENTVSRSVLAAQGSILTNKYAEGYPSRRYYGGCDFVDQAEDLAIARAKKLFGAKYVNVQPHSGSQANMAVYFALLKPGDRILAMDLTHGGHLTHGAAASFSGRLFQFSHYGLSAGTHYATNTITGNQTNGSRSVTVSLEVSNLGEPTVSAARTNASRSFTWAAWSSPTPPTKR